jgi:hypothetical protein
VRVFRSFGSAPAGPSQRPGVLELYRSTLLYCRLNARSVASAAACVLLPFLLAELLFSGTHVADVLRQLDSTQDPEAALQYLRSAWRVLLAWVVWSLVAELIVQPLLLGTLARICQSVWQTGRPAHVRSAFPAALRRLGPAVATVVAVAVLSALVGALVAGIVTLVWWALATAAARAMAVMVAVCVGIAGFVLLIWMSIRLSQAVLVSLLEHGGPVRAIARSWRLTRGAAWYILGFTILAVATAGVTQWLLGVMGALFRDTVVSAIFGVISNFLILPYLAVARALLYLSLAAGEGEKP